MKNEVTTEVVAHRVRHRCVLPGRKERKEQKIDAGSIIRCRCGQHWKWDYGYDTGREWFRVNEDDLK